MTVNIKKDRTMSALARLRDEVKARGMRWTQQRELIASIFLKEKSHVSAEELYDRVKRKDASIGYSTVYRTLKLIVSAGLGSQRKFQADQSVFEPELVGKHHDHLVCLKCGRIIEFENKKIEDLQRDVAEANSFEIKEHRLTLYGYCSNCRVKRGRNRT
jgi:Fur family ferric uptake transcriptional regulator